MTTQAMKNSGMTCKGRGFNCYDCEEGTECVEYVEMRIKLSTLAPDTIVIIDGDSSIYKVSEVLEDLSYFKGKKLYTTTPYRASFDAEDVMETVIENAHCNGMYEDWDEAIRQDVSEEDLKELQAIFDRILARNPSQNVAYTENKPIIIDVE